MSKTPTLKTVTPEQGLQSKKSSTGHSISTRMRRLRRHSGLRRLMQEHHLSVNDLVLPLFVEENLDERTAISSMPGVFRETEKSVAKAVQAANDLGIPAVMMFGISHNKDAQGTDSFRKGGLLDRMVQRVKDSCPEMVVMADLCFCEYTDHGHCGVLDESGDVDNDRTLDNLARQSVIAAKAGADVVAPSGMMDGMVGAIRDALDDNNYPQTAILSYAAKFASSYYGPFREAAGCSLGEAKGITGDRKSYQMNPANAEEALREVELDIEEGADMVMVKPGLAYLDIVRRVKEDFEMPTFAYHVSGEYAMLQAAHEKGWLDYEAVLMETLLAFKRAGCSGILTYGALDAAKALQKP